MSSRAGAAAISRPDLSGLPGPGEQIAGGKYEVERLIGFGGMGAVVVAQHKQLGDRVAIKFLLPAALQSEGALDRFVREARSAVSLKNEHVVRILDVDTLPSGLPYMVMEYLTGADLGEVLELCGALPIAEAVDYLLQACVGVAEAHARGVVHRDLKPANLFVTERPDGSPLVKVLDFGISKAVQLEARADLTSTRTVMGSPLYMSPEQVRSAKLVDTRSDIWALGVILHELVSGHSPFDAETVPAICAQICADPPVPLRTHRPDAPVQLEEVVLRCLDKNRETRFQTVADLARALAPFAAQESLSLIDRVVRRISPSHAPKRLSSPTDPASQSASGLLERRATPQRIAAARSSQRLSSGDAGSQPTIAAPTGPPGLATPTLDAPPGPRLWASASTPAAAGTGRTALTPPPVERPSHATPPGRAGRVALAVLLAAAVIGTAAWLALRPAVPAPREATVAPAAPVAPRPPAPAQVEPPPPAAPTPEAEPTAEVRSEPPPAPAAEVPGRRLTKRPGKRPAADQPPAPLDIRLHR